MKLLVVIVNYRVADLTIDCLRSVASEIASVRGMHVAVCDNGTGDDSAQRIKTAIEANRWGTWCSLTAIKRNLGFTGGNNVILRPTLRRPDPPDYVLLLNADTIVRANAFKILVDFMDQHPEVGIAGSRLEDPDGTPQFSAFCFHSPISELRLPNVKKLLKLWGSAPSIKAPPVTNEAFQTDWVSGASMIIRKEVFQNIGLLDEGYYTYFDDVDLCFNARKAGWPTWYVPASRVVHLVGRTTGVTNASKKRQPAYVFMARRRYFLKNHGAGYAILADAAMIAGLVLCKLRTKLRNRYYPMPTHFLRDSIRHSVFFTGLSLRDVPNPAQVEDHKQSCVRQETV